MKLQSSLLLSTTLLLGACATLPSSGPTGSQVTKAVASDQQMDLSLVEVDSPAQIPPQATDVGMRLMDRPPPPTDMVGPGDVLNVAIYEAGVTLFSNSTGLSGASASAGIDTGARAQNLPEMRVDDNGDITIPYAGKLRVLGETPVEIERQIRLALRGYSQNPQVLVTRRSVITNSVIVGGEVARPGRLVLDTNRETLSDVVALAGGYRGKASDLIVRVKRRDESADYRLSTLLDNPSLDVRAYPGDRYTLIYDPMSFSVLGAAGRMDQIPFVSGTLTLAQAISAAGGPNPNLGDPAAVFVFRYVDDPANPGLRKPVVYHINMMRTGSYFLAQNFRMQNKDVLYFGNARANQPSKVIQLISQLFSPVVAVTSAVSVAKN
ncbi:MULTISPECIES: polysaccharide biosynthesis/export family protein [unclassified Novosphingobium]|uniref:polysaccharide biosynthesis/export family protein n=1 Tax=unclassified Novosphingobium TaxID=2644732 RepID=UPI001493E606|nr:MULTISPECIES: polysaccharide biosynthesis/export family protein [unclassified Novosphingobium]MBB3356499.1 polysaccharide export outer membrane protein [Novosphingobium sp. BK256]MBB3372900.1 polysaccharide export outer membrane protein [Novosphingobium sp. BK280]MBB3377268.1 polysaccharide export outer membrane protein [Novosphingobium sp. BK258]MBB3419321.1 polysaccharide export outer membrane protein [Novosphingobium sp. BK267]MBB3448862.1 polysaccharide export outer membrane protein [No